MVARSGLLFIIGLILTQSGFGWMQTSDGDTVSKIVNQLFGTDQKPRGIPSDPRTVIKLEEQVKTPIKVTVGLKTEILGMLEANLTTEVEYSRSYAVTTWIFSEGKNADIIRQNSAGGYFFDPGDRRTVRLCSLSASFTLSNSYIGKVFLGVSGVDLSRQYAGIEEVMQTSELVEVKPGETPDVHKRACQEFADRKYRDVMTTLRGLAASRIYWDKLSQCNPSEKITSASVCGVWHRTLFPSVTAWTQPVCEKRSGERNYFCTLRSIRGGACSYRDPATQKRLTSGMFEYPCASGLQCTVTKPAGLFNYAKAECRVSVGIEANYGTRTTNRELRTH